MIYKSLITSTVGESSKRRKWKTIWLIQALSFFLQEPYNMKLRDVNSVGTLENLDEMYPNCTATSNDSQLLVIKETEILPICTNYNSLTENMKKTT